MLLSWWVTAPCSPPHRTPCKEQGSFLSLGMANWFCILPALSLSWVLPGCPQEGGRAQLEGTGCDPCGDHPSISVTSHWDGWGWQTQLCLGVRRSRTVSVSLGGCCREGAARGTPPAPLTCPVAQAEAPRLFLALLPCPWSPSPSSTSWSCLSDANFSFSISSQGPSRRASPPAWLPG